MKNEAPGVVFSVLDLHLAHLTGPISGAHVKAK